MPEASRETKHTNDGAADVDDAVATALSRISQKLAAVLAPRDAQPGARRHLVKILVVSPDPRVKRLLRALSCEEDLILRTAPDPAAAADLLDASRYDLVLFDSGLL